MILFGMGQLGQYMLAQLGSRVEAATDNNSDLWNTHRGVLILSPEECVAAYPDSEYVVSIYNGAAVRKQLREMGVRRISHFLEVLGRDTIDHEKVAELRPLLADDESRRELDRQVSGETLLDHLPIQEIYFPPFFPRRSDEVFVDCGAYDGDSVRAFKSWAGSWKTIYALEPIAKVLEPAIHLPLAVGSANEFVRFSDAGPGSKQSESGRMVQVVRLDDLFLCDPPTFIKMDVEGAEPEAIRGAAQIIRGYAPKMAVCLYHKRSHLWEIPLLLHSLRPDYKLYIRRYAEDCWEIVCYAIAGDR